jgi:hypothetical protein
VAATLNEKYTPASRFMTTASPSITSWMMDRDLVMTASSIGSPFIKSGSFNYLSLEGKSNFLIDGAVQHATF